MATFNINIKFNSDFKKIMSFELFNFGNNYYAFIFDLNLEKKNYALILEKIIMLYF
jgi:hypothetical protein